MAQEADDIVGTGQRRIVEEASFRKLPTRQFRNTGSSRVARHTSSAARNVCGHLRDLGAFDVVLDARRFDIGCAVAKEAKRSSNVKK